MPTWIIQFMAPRFGWCGNYYYGNGFRPYGWHWCGYFVRETPWPFEMAAHLYRIGYRIGSI